MRRVLGRANSSNVMKVLWLLDELGLPFEREDYGGAFGRVQTPEYRALNPNSVVPTLVEDEFVLWESNAILRYLAAGHAAGTPMWPGSLQRRANIDRWMDWQQTTLGTPMTTVFWGLVRTPPDKRDTAAVTAAAARLGVLYGILDGVVAREGYVAGPELTPADICIGVHAFRYFSFEGIERPAMPALEDWFARLRTRPAFATHVDHPMT